MYLSPGPSEAKSGMQRVHKKALEHKTNLLSTNVPRKVLFWKIDSPSLYKLAEKAHLSSQGLRKLFG